MSRPIASVNLTVVHLATGSAAVLALILACGSHLPAQPPSDPAPPLGAQPPSNNTSNRARPVETEFPSGFPPLVEPTADPAAAERIQRALQGSTSEPVPGGVLGDVIDIIRTQGSILDGSSLDRRRAHLEDEATSNPDILPSETARSSVQAAEALLRSARLLESLPARHDAQSDRLPIAELVRHMRIQATRLMLSEFPQAID